MDLNLIDFSREEYEAIASQISSADSPVGIDAKHTHIVIIHLLRDIQRRLERLEQAGRGEVN